MSKTLKLVLSSLLSLLTFSINAAASSDISQLIEQQLIATDRLIIQFKSDTHKDHFFLNLNYPPLKFSQPFYQPKNYKNALKNWQVVTLTPGSSLLETIETLKSSPNVAQVLPDLKVQIHGMPNDLTDTLWGLNNDGQNDGLVDADIDAVEAWDIENSAENVIVAVIDSGVDYQHPELKNNMWRNPGEIPNNNIDDDNNGFVDDVHGWDFANNDSDPMDDHSHGTHVAGTIGAEGNNNQGIVGVTWRTQIMALKFLNADSNGYTSDAINAILYAVDQGARISNNSWGSFGRTYALEVFNQPLREAIALAQEADHLFVASAGNSGYFTDDKYSAHPAGMTLPNILSVAATDRKDQLADFSNFGPIETDLAAPGVEIFSTLPNNEYAAYDGTSMASPHVSGVAALLLSLQPDLSALELKTLLMQTVDGIAALQNQVASNGRLNAASALSRLTEGPLCQDFSATPAAHKNAGRGGYCGAFNQNICALGSDQVLGSKYSLVPVRARFLDSDYVTKGQCPSIFDRPPTITVQGTMETRLLAGSSFTTLDYSAQDHEDGDITARVEVQTNLNLQVPGNYTVNYQVRDSLGQTSLTEKHLVQVLASDEPPMVYLFGPPCILPLICIPILMKQHTPFDEPGYIAADELDGDLTQNVVVDSPLLSSTSTIGRFKVNYDVEDSSGQHFPGRESVFRDVFVLHKEQPYIHLATEDVVINHALGVCCANTSPFAVDLVDELQSVTTTGEVNYDQIGSYQLTHEYTDTDGNTATRLQTVNIIQDVTAPSIELNGAEEMTSVVGEYWSDPWVTATDDLDRYPSVYTEGVVNEQAVGSYQKHYWAKDDSGNESSVISRTINIVPACTEFAATNLQHTQASRASACTAFSSYTCAKGSQDNLGLTWSSSPTTVYELFQNPGVFYKGSCPAN